MGRTYLRQDAQVHPSQTYSQTLASGVALQSSALNLEDDLNALRSQVNRIIDVTMAGNFYDALPIVNSKNRGIKQLAVAVDGLETKPQLKRVFVGTATPVPAGQNYVVLSAANSQVPSLPLAIAASSIGAVVAQSANNAAAFAANELTAVAGSTGSRPKNLCIVHDSTTGQAVESGGFDVYALIQAESTATDGGTANDTSGGNRVKLSFVTISPSGVISAAATSDMGGKSIQYTYCQRLINLNVPEDAYVGQDSLYVDQIAAVDITLSTAVINQAGAGIPVGSDVLWRLASSKNFKVQNSAGSTDFLAIGSTGATTMNVPSLNIVSTAAPNISAGVSVATATQAVNVGTTVGQIDSAGLTLNATGANVLKMVAGNAINLQDGFLAGSTYTGAGVKLAAASSEWSQFTTNFGATASLVSALNQAAQKASHAQYWANVTAASITAGTNVSGAGSTPNIDQQFPAYSDFVGQVMVFLNGMLMRPGANAAAGADVYPGTNPANGDLMFTFNLKNSGTHTDVISFVISESTYNT